MIYATRWTAKHEIKRKGADSWRNESGVIRNEVIANCLPFLPLLITQLSSFIAALDKEACGSLDYAVC